MGKRISDNVEAILNKQIKHEFDNSRLYLSMSQCLEFNGWFGAAKLWKKYSDEEIGHGEKIMSYMQDRDCKPTTPDTTQPTKDYKGIKEIVNLSDKREVETTAEWKNIAMTAWKEGDILTFNLAQVFLNEQVEEEAKTIYWRDRIVMYEMSNKPLGDIDKEMGSKV